MIALHHCAKEQLAWLDVVKIRAPYCPCKIVLHNSEDRQNLTGLMKLSLTFHSRKLVLVQLFWGGFLSP